MPFFCVHKYVCVVYGNPTFRGALCYLEMHKIMEEEDAAFARADFASRLPVKERRDYQRGMVVASLDRNTEYALQVTREARLHEVKNALVPINIQHSSDMRKLNKYVDLDTSRKRKVYQDAYDAAVMDEVDRVTALQADNLAMNVIEGKIKKPKFAFDPEDIDDIHDVLYTGGPLRKNTTGHVTIRNKSKVTNQIKELARPYEYMAKEDLVAEYTKLKRDREGTERIESSVIAPIHWAISGFSNYMHPDAKAKEDLHFAHVMKEYKHRFGSNPDINDRADIIVHNIATLGADYAIDVVKRQITSVLSGGSTVLVEGPEPTAPKVFRYPNASYVPEVD